MLNFVKLPIVLSALFLCSYVPMASGQSSLDRRLANALEDTLPGLVIAEDHRAASNIAMQLASARSRLGETTAACAALAQSLEHYRKALAKEAGGFQTVSGISDDSDVLATLHDDSDAMAVVRAKFGCTRT